MDAPQSGPREVGDTASFSSGVFHAALCDQVPHGGLGKAHDPVSEKTAVFVVEVSVDQPCDSLGEGALDLPYGVGERLVVEGARTEQQAESSFVLGDEVEVRLEPSGHLGMGTGRIRSRLEDDVAQTGAYVGEQLEEEVVLRGEVLVEHGLGDAGRFCDRGHRCAVEAGYGEHVEGRVQ